MANYNYLNQSIVSSCLIESKDIDSFYNPTTLRHTGFAWDGQLYYQGVLQPGPVYASWYSEGAGTFRGSLQTFPQEGLVLLSKVALSILDESTTNLTMWMQFLIQNDYAFPDNFNDELNGWRPSGLAYADGILSITYIPDYGNQPDNILSNMVVSIDFTQDKVYLDVAT